MIRFAVALVFLASPICADGFESGNTLHERCSQPSGSLRIDYCMGYVVGIADALYGSEINGFNVCIPERVTGVQVRDIAVAFLQEHPELRHYSADGLIASALEEAFPC